MFELTEPSHIFFMGGTLKLVTTSTEELSYAGC
jgi:hypothetical protein